jgi:hypothetical protein
MCPLPVAGSCIISGGLQRVFLKVMK